MPQMTTITSPRRDARLRTMNRAALGTLTVIALAYAAGALASGLVWIIGSLVRGTTTLSLLTQSQIPQSAVSADIQLVSGTYSQAAVEIRGLGGGVVALDTVATALGTLTQVLIALSVAYLGWKLLRGEPFRRSVTRVVAFAACALLIGGALGQIAQQAANLIAITELTGKSLGNDVFPFIAGFDPTFFLVGLALGLVAAAFETGERLQRDTEGLV
jgi:hypothetical protein